MFSVMFVWCTVRVRTRSYLQLHGCVFVSGLYGVPLVYARDRTYMGVSLCHVCMVYRKCTHAFVLTLIKLYRGCMVYRLRSVSVILPLLGVFRVCQLYAACCDSLDLLPGLLLPCCSFHYCTSLPSLCI